MLSLMLLMFLSMILIICGHNDGNSPAITGNRWRRSFFTLVHFDKIQNGGFASRLVKPPLRVPPPASLIAVEQMLLLDIHIRDIDFINALILAFCLPFER